MSKVPNGRVELNFCGSIIFCITCYCTVLIIEYVPLALENRQLAKNKLAHAIAHNFHLIMPLFAGIGAIAVGAGALFASRRRS